MTDPRQLSERIADIAMIPAGPCLRTDEWRQVFAGWVHELLTAEMAERDGEIARLTRELDIARARSDMNGGLAEKLVETVKEMGERSDRLTAERDEARQAARWLLRRLPVEDQHGRWEARAMHRWLADEDPDATTNTT